jgi:hypothetical protein
MKGETFHQCDCGIYVSDRGNEQWDAPHFGPFEKIEGSCSGCLAVIEKHPIRELKARGFSDGEIFGQTILSGGTSDGDEVGSVDTERDASILCRGSIVHGVERHLVSPVKPVQFRPAAQINYYGKAA